MSGGWVKLAENKAAGTSTWICPDPDDPEGVLIQQRQDVTALLDDITAQRNVASSNWKGDYHSVARIPAAMAHDTHGQWHEAMREGDDAHIAKLLNDGDFAKLRTKGGVI